MRPQSKILFFALMLFLSSITLVSFFLDRQVVHLYGSFKKIERPVFAWKIWFSGDYQSKMDERTKTHFFLRSALIKLRNQFDYTLFDKVNAKDVVKGRDNVLYQKPYIDSYLGLTFIGENKIDNRLDKIKKLQDTLAKMDKKLLVVIAPSKAAYFPNNFPVRYDTISKRRSNYDYFSKQIIDKGINHLDFNKMFLGMQDTISYPVFSRKGIHWSSSCKQIVWNTIAEKLEADSDWKLGRLKSRGVEWRQPEGEERDLYDLLNIYGYKDDAKMAYHDYYVDTIDVDRPLGMVIGDSFFWGLRGLGFSREILNDGQYWYYNKSVYPAEHGIIYKKEDFDLRSTALKNDIIILMANPSNLVDFPFGFESELLTAILNPPSPKEVRAKEVGRMVKRIRKNEEWFSKLKAKSLKSGTPLDTLMYIDADYFLKQEAKKKANQKQKDKNNTPE